MATNNNLVTVRFRNHSVPNETRSKEAGRPIFTDMEVCDIFFAANQLTKATFPAHDHEPNATREAAERGEEPVTYAMLYKDQYMAFKRGEAQPESGTPLSELPFLTEGKRRELKALNVHTAEALAALDGQPLKMIGMGGRELKNQAQAYIDNALGSADVTKMAAEIEALRSQLAEERALREEFTEQAVKTREQKKLEREFAKEFEAEAKEQAKIDRAMQRKLEKSDEKWEKETEKAERGTLTASTDFEKWDDEQLKAFIAEHTGARPRGNPSHATLVEAAKEIKEAL